MQTFIRPTTRVVLVTGAVGAALIGAVSVGGAAFAGGHPAPSASGSTSAAPAPGAVTPPDAAASGAPATPGARHGRHQPHIGGEVQSVSGSTVVVKDGEGFTRTIRLVDGATVTKDGAGAGASAIVKGQHIDATGAVASDGTTLDASAVAVGRPAGRAGGPGASEGPGADHRGRGADGAGPQRGDAPAAPAPGTSAPGAPSTAPPAPSANGSAPASPAPGAGS